MPSLPTVRLFCAVSICACATLIRRTEARSVLEAPPFGESARSLSTSESTSNCASGAFQANSNSALSFPPRLGSRYCARYGAAIPSGRPARESLTLAVWSVAVPPNFNWVSAATTIDPSNSTGLAIGQLRSLASRPNWLTAISALGTSAASDQVAAPPVSAKRANSTFQSLCALVAAGAEAAATGAGTVSADGPAGAIARFNCPAALRATTSCAAANSSAPNLAIRSSGRTSSSDTLSLSAASKGPPAASATLTPVICTEPVRRTVGLANWSNASLSSAPTTPRCRRTGTLAGI